MKKLYLCADIEGTAGISSWDEATGFDGPEFDRVTRQMTREVAAACTAAFDAGYDKVIIRDAHSKGRNLHPEMLPRRTELLRGHSNEPMSILAGVEDGCHATVFTGFHCSALNDGNPLSHTMTRRVRGAILNGERLSEALMFAYAAAYHGVPLLALSGDGAVCEQMKTLSPALTTIPVIFGSGDGTRSLQGDDACDAIYNGMLSALKNDDRDGCLLKLPEHFSLDLSFNLHPVAKRNSYYPGAVQTDAHTIHFETDDYFEILRMYHFMF